MRIPGRKQAGGEGAGQDEPEPAAASQEAAVPEAAGRKAAGPEAASPEAAGREAAGREAAGPETASQETASQELAVQTAGLVGDLAAEERRGRRRFRAGAERRARHEEPAGVLRSRLSALSALGGQAAGQTAKAAGVSARAAGRGAQVAARGARLGGAWLAEQVLATAPRLPVRDLATLNRHFPGLGTEELADALIDSAARMSAMAGAAVGSWAVIPFLPGMPAEVATETLTVVGIEIKLVAELHEVYGMRAPGGVVDRMTAYTAAWASRRGVGITPAGVVLAVGSPLRRRLQRRLAARAGESVLSLGPLLTGAVASALLNRRETRRLGHDIRDDLRRHSRHTLPEGGSPAGSRQLQ